MHLGLNGVASLVTRDGVGPASRVAWSNEQGYNTRFTKLWNPLEELPQKKNETGRGQILESFHLGLTVHHQRCLNLRVTPRHILPHTERKKEKQKRRNGNLCCRWWVPCTINLSKLWVLCTARSFKTDSASGLDSIGSAQFMSVVPLGCWLQHSLWTFPAKSCDFSSAKQRWTRKNEIHKAHSKEASKACACAMIQALGAGPLRLGPWANAQPSMDTRHRSKM